ncbi:ATP-dependent DNA helicase Q-like SIM [Lactuca sativa]|nr:ATP-dependent DNA helicase Q-like SIM [Lactuca sativa]XP_052623170.1 ATP-dependent DNA helicase Q-like SIM [Lactuca sativa]XP_052623171.1 ATP-dependent DNA helicase Q-like SIM [Lactuca sativa]
MDGNNLASDQVIAELMGMGFQISEATKAIKEVGPSLNNAIDFILNAGSRNQEGTSNDSSKKVTRKKDLSAPGKQSGGRMRQLSIMDHLQSAGKPKVNKTSLESETSFSRTKVLSFHGEGCEAIQQPIYSSYSKAEQVGEDWELKANALLQKHFGYSSLKRFQKEALAAWMAHKDCLVLAATGSGKSLCFQIPALLTGKVVVVISPLISLMHDQCLKLSKHGVSACFLGSGQIDHTVEEKSMRGMYEIIYVCPETILRLIKPLQILAERRGIALFAIDEVHCVSKWGHDFRPDYRRMSALRENFSAKKLDFLKFDIPIMALTATATTLVCEDILNSLKMSKDPKIVLTSFFRPNLRFSVKHSKTCSSSYEKDFHDLIETYTRNQKHSKKNILISPASCSSVGTTSQDETIKNWLDCTEERASSETDDDDDDVDISLPNKSLKRKELSVEYLEDECDLLLDADDLDVTCGEFNGRSSPSVCGIQGKKTEVEQGSTIIYVPTRKDTLTVAKYLCRFGVKAAAYHAKLPKSHLRQVHMEFHENAVQVVVATIAFGMGIDKLNVRRIIHYGWPQSLEAYYQEAGRAGRDGKLADCVLYANLSRMPSLLPNKRSEEQTKQAYKMLSDCFRYAMSTYKCRAQMLVQYFGEDFSHETCHLCDICVKGPPEKQDLKDEARVLMGIIAAHYEKRSHVEGSYDDDDDDDYKHNRRQMWMEMENVRMIVSKIREQNPQHATTDLLWWRGLIRILEDKGYLREGDEKRHVQIKFPEPTKHGLEFLRGKSEEPFYVWPEADMLLSETMMPKSYSSFAEWGKGWADPEIRKQRLGKNRPWKQPRQKKKRKQCHLDTGTVRGRLAAKLSK